MATLLAPAFELPTSLHSLTNLADSRIGAQIVECSDDFFAEAKRMLQFEAPIFVEDKFDDHGKWMDGWETRRKRHAGYDWCIVKLGVAGKIKAVDIDTTFFTGNYPASASLEGCYAPNGNTQEALWQPLLGNSILGPSQHHVFDVQNDAIFTHIRLNIFPDGGVARLRIYGDVQIQITDTDQTLDLLALQNGGRVIAYSDAHFGHPRNLINPGRGVNMGDGWETKRRRAPGFDWCLLALGQAGKIEKIEIDTAHFKGNYPAQVSIQAIYIEDATDPQLIPQSMFWPFLLEAQDMQMDHIHSYLNEVLAHEKVSHIRVNMIPDGGISRVRLWGKVV
ncbi:allantoicase [Acinetobacter baylyi]|uniref:Probable allantoicase n=1 Tax=Acinetobacter baylyi (strain ATCC 33305 / BD413 / ADP1) TaxID=62977 RepID=ALLC_ACIAD|nr:allantoicase [Acinetobacter baylyi]Q6F6Y1.1 RecName: Full=Probable allantoicase; AltName: Full=Allantoate amidinohydrolase [Acinetobacter baylyi ADP1]ENV55278.1 allantoicase [Acinetobacter baylyi DSM 14961 = CIP 107474]KAF2370993.1 allantoicase [Acinetobacter baylyi]KAF2374797.1 allantoicase [Acinetobacter baylyi]KAF2379006.1 allantoicase [Acinetobacter baylyi]KAF2381931.1 allantoicase [Acinetobacter baylyi]